MLGIHGYDIEGGSWPHTREQAVQRGKDFDGLVAGPSMYKNDADDMRAANPDLILWAYANGTHTKTTQSFPADWYLYDKDGNKIHAGDPWQSNLLMNPLSQGWIDYKVGTLETLAATSGYGAVYVDELGQGCVTNTTSAPLGQIGVIDPRTDQPWTKEDWMVEMGDYLARITAALDVPVWCNGLGSNERFYGRKAGTTAAPVAPTSSLLACDGAAAELYMRGPNSPLDRFPTLAWWKAELQMTVDAGPKLMSLTKTWVTSPPQALVDQWHRLALGTFMLGGGRFFYFTRQRAVGVTPLHPFWTHAKQLGDPTAAYVAQKSGLYRRQHENGFVVVNPNEAGLSIAVTRRMVGLGGVEYAAGATVEIAPHDGQVFRRA